MGEEGALQVTIFCEGIQLFYPVLTLLHLSCMIKCTFHCKWLDFETDYCIRQANINTVLVIYGHIAHFKVAQWRQFRRYHARDLTF